MESPVAAEMEALKIECHIETQNGGDEDEEHLEDGGSVQTHKSNKNKKKKKKKPKSHSTSLGGFVPGPGLPSQTLVESLFPWKMVVRPSRGRCAIAVRDIKVGEVVVSEQAVAFVPRTQDRTAVCHQCCRDLGQSTPSVECSNCKHVVFCKDCEVSAMADHSKWCKVTCEVKEIAKLSDCDEDLLHFVMALALKRPIGEEKTEDNIKVKGLGVLRDGIIHSSFQDALSLQTHKEKAAASWKESVRKGCNLLLKSELHRGDTKSLSGTGLQSFCLEELEMLALLVNTNAHGMGAQGLHNSDVALGIFPFVSMLNHSCWCQALKCPGNSLGTYLLLVPPFHKPSFMLIVHFLLEIFLQQGIKSIAPNCCFASEGTVMTVRATQDIPKDTELCVSYINLYEPRRVRKQNLADTKHFDCSCLRCSEPLISSVDRYLEAAMCSVKGCVGVQVKLSSLHGQHFLPNGSSSWECDVCHRVTNLVAPPVFSGKSLTGVDKPWDLEVEAENRLAAAMVVYRERKFKNARALLERFLADYNDKLHALHVFLFDALTPLMNCCRALGDIGDAARVCTNIISCLEKVIPGYSLEVANFYFCLGEMYSERAESSNLLPAIAKRYRKQAQDAFQKVRTIRKVCLGKANLPPC